SQCRHRLAVGRPGGDRLEQGDSALHRLDASVAGTLASLDHRCRRSLSSWCRRTIQAVVARCEHPEQAGTLPMSTVSDFPSTRPGGWDDPAAAPIPAPLRLHETTVGPQWVDYNGHMSEWCYLLVMGDSSDQFFRYVGIDDAYRAGGRSLY